MKITDLVRWSLLAGAAFSNPLKVDIKVDNVDLRLDIDDHETRLPSRARTRPSALTSSTLPIVTLAYELHQASPDISSEQTYYNFSNIPYAHQPIGNRRFKAAEDLSDQYVDDPPLNDGQQSAICPQGFGGWFPFAGNFSSELFLPGDSLALKWLKKITPDKYPPSSSIKQAPNQNESCLLLDVFVDKKQYDIVEAPLVPVIINFHGGGYAFGSKTEGGGPSSILAQAGQFENGQVIVVSVNYRLGAFGWLAGDEFTEGGGFTNAGFSDQVAAIDWVYYNIMAFGGDPSDITLLGESAGASSIMHHLTAYAGGSGRNGRRTPLPKFRRAILQSPAYFPTADYTFVNNTYRAFLDAAGAKNFTELQNKPTADLIKANFDTIYGSPYGLFTYGPFTSGGLLGAEFANLPPIALLKFGTYWRDIEVMVANNRREGSIFTPPWLRGAGAIKEHLVNLYPKMTSEDIETFVKLYPVPQILTTPKAKFLYSAAPFGDLGIDCNTWAIRNAYPTSYEYYYRIYPGFHGQDVGATWWPNAGENLTNLNVEEQSLRLQRYLTSFAKFGNPNQHKLSADKDWPSVSDSKYMYFGDGEPRLPGFKDKNYGAETEDPLPSSTICEFWQSVPWWAPEEDVLAQLAEHLQVQGEL